MKITSSKFSVFPIILCFLFTSISIVPMSISYPYEQIEIFFLIPMLIFLLFFWMTEFRTKAHKVHIYSGVIEVRKFFGLGRPQEIKIADIKGYIITQQTGGIGKYEYIFLVNERKRLISVSEFYHRNYSEIKKEIEKKTTFLGEKKFGFSEEYAEMFK